MVEGRGSQVRERREARGLTQVGLAGRARLTRQSLGAIEAGRSVPSVEVALRIARALDARVEELFGDGAEAEHLVTAAADPSTTGRVALAHLADRWVSLPLSGEGLRLSADGVVAGAGAAGAVVAPVRPLEEARQNVVVTGCAAALGLVADRLNARKGAGRFLWFPRGSTAALEALARGMTHVAGVHLTDPTTGEANVSDVRRAAASEPLVLVTLARWEAGLLVRPDDTRRIRTAADLGRKGLRLVVREAGAGAQRLLDRELEAAGQTGPSGGRPRTLVATGHLEVARLIAMGAADTGVATRDAALAFGLGFVPLAEERYDLVMPRSLLADPRIERWLDVLVSAAVRRELSCLGYDVTSTGERVAEVEAA
jgi:putative molybdopterin biosynthesis protein